MILNDCNTSALRMTTCSLSRCSREPSCKPSERNLRPIRYLQRFPERLQLRFSVHSVQECTYAFGRAFGSEPNACFCLPVKRVQHGVQHSFRCRMLENKQMNCLQAKCCPDFSQTAE